MYLKYRALVCTPRIKWCSFLKRIRSVSRGSDPAYRVALLGERLSCLTIAAVVLLKTGRSLVREQRRRRSVLERTKRRQGSREKIQLYEDFVTSNGNIKEIGLARRWLWAVRRFDEVAGLISRLV